MRGKGSFFLIKSWLNYNFGYGKLFTQSILSVFLPKTLRFLHKCWVKIILHLLFFSKILFTNYIIMKWNNITTLLSKIIYTVHSNFENNKLSVVISQRSFVSCQCGALCFRDYCSFLVIFINLKTF